MRINARSKAFYSVGISAWVQRRSSRRMFSGRASPADDSERYWIGRPDEGSDGTGRLGAHQILDTNANVIFQSNSTTTKNSDGSLSWSWAHQWLVNGTWTNASIGYTDVPLSQKRVQSTTVFNGTYAFQRTVNSVDPTTGAFQVTSFGLLHPRLYLTTQELSSDGQTMSVNAWTSPGPQPPPVVSRMAGSWQMPSVVSAHRFGLIARPDHQVCGGQCSTNELGFGVDALVAGMIAYLFDWSFMAGVALGLDAIAALMGIIGLM
ncbi:MAG: hypothetical protein JO121_05740 [Deltaproteobacteria bacterium]|nr:hypothetical protein [Deltaproteobacteria bacterium]